MAAEENDTGVEIQHLTAQPVVSIRETIQVADLGAAMGDRIGALASFLAQSGAQIAGPPFVRRGAGSWRGSLRRWSASCQSGHLHATHRPTRAAR
jgi:hypothetical protein